MNAQDRPPKKRLNVTVDPDLLADARALDLNISRIVEAGLRDAVRSAKAAAWVEENRAAMESQNEWLRKNGLPFADIRVMRP